MGNPSRQHRKKGGRKKEVHAHMHCLQYSFLYENDHFNQAQAEFKKVLNGQSKQAQAEFKKVLNGQSKQAQAEKKGEERRRKRQRVSELYGTHTPKD